MHKIPIVISSDNKIFFTVGVVLTSLLENANPQTFYEINVFHTQDVEQDNLEKLQILEEKYKNASIKTYNMGEKFKDIPSTNGYHVNYVSAYKMLIPSMFPQYDKLIYLDTDIIVRGDLEELYNFDIGSNYIASTPVFSNILNNQFKQLSNLMDIPDLDYYVNAGVMLMNLKKIREDKIDEKWISLLGSFKGSVDQHILNKVCYGKTDYLPLKFNTCLTELELYKSEEANSYYTAKVIGEALENPIIFHWTGKMKPWIYRDTYLAQEWLKYFNKSPYKLILNRTLSEKVTVLRHFILGIPIFKMKEYQHKKRGYLFNIIRIYTMKKGN